MTAAVDADVAPFERWAGSYDRHWSQTVFFDRVHTSVLSEIARIGVPRVVLDVGCGTGKLLSAIGLRFPTTRLLGVDPAPAMVATASERAAGARSVAFATASATALPFDEASCDLVVSTSSFHHWDDQRQGLVEVCRVLRPGGALILADGARGRIRRPRLGLLSRALNGHHDGSERFYTPAGLAQMMRDAGLEVFRQRRTALLASTIPVTCARKGA